MAHFQDSMDRDVFESLEVGPSLPEARRKLLLEKVTAFLWIFLLIAVVSLPLFFPWPKTKRETAVLAVPAAAVIAAALGYAVAYRRRVNAMANEVERLVLGPDSVVLEKHRGQTEIPYEAIVHIAVRYLIVNKYQVTVSHCRAVMEIFGEDNRVLGRARGSLPSLSKAADKLRQQVWWATGYEDSVGDQESDREIRVRQKAPLLRLAQYVGAVAAAVCLAMIGFAFHLEGMAGFSPWTVVLVLSPLLALAILCLFRYDVAMVGRGIAIMPEGRLAEDYVRGE